MQIYQEMVTGPQNLYPLSKRISNKTKSSTIKMNTNTPNQLPDEVVEEIKKRAAEKTNKENARLNATMKDYSSKINWLDGYEKGCVALGTEYATKLHQLDEHFQCLKISYDATLEKYTKSQQEIEQLRKYAEQCARQDAASLKAYNAARALLEKVILRQQGLIMIHDIELYNEIKTFLDGK